MIRYERKTKMGKQVDFKGDIKISDSVVASIAGLAASETEGVNSLSGNLTNEIVAKFGIKNNSKGVKLDINQGDVVADIYVDVIYGYSIPDVSAKVQEKVKQAIESMTGLNVVGVNVRVVGITVKV
ncbi:MAG: Asp23/Gls24 family envelope stress response protein [Lachnospiraceae bacterium]|nr:Asp23/Gls24 family envelope stress response protein [Lachnospiraceae bacterium]